MSGGRWSSLRPFMGRVGAVADERRGVSEMHPRTVLAMLSLDRLLAFVLKELRSRTK